MNSNRLFRSVVTVLLWCVAAGGEHVLAATYTVSNSGIPDQGDPNRHGSLQWVLNQVGSALATVVLPNDSNNTSYRIGTSRNIVVPANVNLVFQSGAVITFQSTNSTLKIFGSIEAALQQIFDASPGQVRFQGNDTSVILDPARQYRIALIKEVYPQWWGATAAPGVPESLITCRDNCNPAKNLQAFRAAFLAFPTKVTVPAGTYVLSGEWRLDFQEIPDAFVGLSFNVSGMGAEDGTTLIQESGSSATQFVGIYGNYPTRFWQDPKFRGFKILNPKRIGLKIQNPLVRVSDLRIESIPASGVGIEIEPNSHLCRLEQISLYGPGPSSFAASDFDPDDPKLSSGLKSPGGSLSIMLSRFGATSFDIGINLFGRDDIGGFGAWRILDSVIQANRIGINIGNFLDRIHRTSPVNMIDIIGSYIETSYSDPTYGIRLDRCWTGLADDAHRCPYGVRIEGLYIDPKAPNAREIEIHGNAHIIDAPYHGRVYGTCDVATQIRSGTFIDDGGTEHPAPYYCK